MKKIQFLTDYSRYSPQVWHYALHLAHYFDAILHATHIYHPDFKEVLKEYPDIEGLSDQFFEEALYEQQSKEETRLETFIDTLTPQDMTDIKVEKYVIYGYTISEILQLQESNEFDLIVMGLNAAPTPSGHILGKTAHALINFSESPVLLIPPETKYHPIRHMVLPSRHLPEDLKTINYLLEWTETLGAKLFCYHLQTEEDCQEEEMTFNDALEIDEILSAYHGDQLTFSVTQGCKKDLIGHVEEITSILNADILVLTTHQQGVFDKIFDDSPIKRIASDLKVPVLILKTSWLAQKSTLKFDIKEYC